MDTVFRILLANGNEPMTAEEILQQLSLRREYSSLGASALERLLDGDRYYGIARA